MASESKQTATGWTPAGQRACGNVLVKTGTDQLDPDMVRQGKQALKEAETAASPAPPPKA